MLRFTRRDLLKQGAAAGGLLALLDGAPASAAGGKEVKIKDAQQFRTICPYCSVGCGIVMTEKNGTLVGAMGDPDHPINEGALCCKGASVLNLRQVADKNGNWTLNPRRLTKVLYRAPHSDRWEEKDWSWAMEQIARRVKTTRDATFEVKDSQGVTVNRTFGITHIGSAALDNEENYALSKMMRAMGVVRVEHHARL